MALENDTVLREFIRRVALLNAVGHDGKAQAGALVGKVLGEKAQYRNQVKELSGVINAIVAEVNSLTLSEQKAIVEKNWPETQKKPEVEEKKLTPLPSTDKYKVITTRFSPNPDCVLHLGSARAIVLSHEYACMYNGKFILRFEDTDPKTKKPQLEFYENIRKDLKWLGCRWDEEYIQSDRLKIYYEIVGKMVGDGNAYVCECTPEAFRGKAVAKEACPCRNIPPSDQLQRWQKMLAGDYQEGEAVIRVKTELDHPNPAIRDWPALRIIDTKKYPHPRVGSKYHLWPLYNLAAGIDDHLMGITHIIRGKEHYTNMIRQKYMYQHLGWEYPQAIHYGRLKITGAALSKSKIVAGINEGDYTDFDDPRLGTFAALKKRGIQPEAIKKMIIEVGVKPNDVTLSWESLYAHNRKILDATSNRYFFTADPIELHVSGLPKTFHAKLPLHPEHPERGFREYLIEPQGDKSAAMFWITKKDAETMQTTHMMRLMELFNIQIDTKKANSITATYTSESYEDVRKNKVQLIQWIPKGAEYPAEIIHQDASVTSGFAEAACKKLKPDDIIQFERYGFVRINEASEKLIAYYAQK
ncbi:glutamate--tRNA ligase [Candidatus Bathycorpusculum sp.]|uniref:glutamate--tRNA ligase n=1 Tax=Candidatus Bathycorpusculum sp. TaxID=2994959 RepID=UPI002822D431|nr:glutamate--tRNA ligase [Candidatus Termitimicrobium sp.]MCL2432093.1 glutamate--tRNA ligase [Candidatus Termitimicrobium sp.]